MPGGGPTDQYDTFINFENATGTAFNDTLFGSALPNVLFGSDGNDVLHGFDGNDTLEGGLGVDEFNGGPHDDLIKAQDGVPGELIGCGTGTDSVQADAGDLVNPDCENVELPPSTAAVSDYDGDGMADPGLFRTSNGRWYARTSSAAPDMSIGFGTATDIPVPGDHDGDGGTGPALFRPSNGRFCERTSGPGADISTAFGTAGDIKPALPHAVRTTYGYAAQ